ncbi:MAG: hypothetical protein ACLVEX_08395 [Ruthenibacterium lactatiformans]
MPRGGQGRRRRRVVPPGKYVAAGGPDGGDGGRGGGVVFGNGLIPICPRTMDFRYKSANMPPSAARRKQPRRGASGKSAPDLVIRVPRGTLVRRRAERPCRRGHLRYRRKAVVASRGKGGKGGWEQRCTLPRPRGRSRRLRSPAAARARSWRCGWS